MGGYFRIKDMQTLTIPKKLTQKGELVVIPRREYEDLLRVHKKHKEFYTELDKDLRAAVRDHKVGLSYGPFETLEESRSFIEKRGKTNNKK